MAIPFFKSFRSTVAPFLLRNWTTAVKLLVDPVTGAPTGIANFNDNGPDGVWAPVDVSAAQITTPPAAMVSDLSATYRLNVAPYSRYRSDGTQIVGWDGNNVQGPNGLFGNMVVYSPFTVSDPAGVVVRGKIHVISFPA